MREAAITTLILAMFGLLWLALELQARAEKKHVCTFDIHIISPESARNKHVIRHCGEPVRGRLGEWLDCREELLN